MTNDPMSLATENQADAVAAPTPTVVPPAAPAMGEATPLSQIPEVRPENLDLLFSMATAHIREQKIGQFQGYRTPFSVQVTSDSKLLYPLLRSAFKTADRALGDTRTRSISLQMTTLILFSAYTAIILWLIQRAALADGASALAFVEGHFLPLAGLALIGATSGFYRRERLDKISSQGSDFGTWFARNYNLLKFRVRTAVDYIDVDNATQDGSDDRARRWTYVALWLDEMVGRLDRYVTTTTWRVQTSLTVISRIFQVLRWALIASIIYSMIVSRLLLNQPLIAAILLVALLPVPLIWDVGIGRRKSLVSWRRGFVSAAPAQSVEEVFQGHIYTLLSDKVKVMRGIQLAALKRSG